jgi:acyltransferase
MTIKNQRVEYIDFLKGLLLTLICFSHFGYLPYLLKLLIIPAGSIYVPAFFIISGFLFKENITFNRFLKKKIKTLLIPYIFFFLIFLILDWNIYLKPVETFSSFLDSPTRAGGPPKASPIWFIIRLFEVNLLWYFINYFLPKKSYKFIFIIISSFLGYIFYINSIKLPFAFEVILSSIVFFGLGHLSKEKLKQLMFYLNQKSWVYNILVASSILFISMFFDFKNGYGLSLIHI